MERLGIIYSGCYLVPFGFARPDMPQHQTQSIPESPKSLSKRRPEALNLESLGPITHS